MVAVNKLYSVTELAAELKVTPRALRFYEDKGLIVPQRAGKTRVYTHRDRGRIILILRGKRLGFSLREIAEWLDLYDQDPGQVEQMRLTLSKTRKRIKALEARQRDLEETLQELRGIETAVEDFLKSKGADAEAAE
ncbi:MerR family DNA-binding transcriptional regulator [Pelagibius litoralis]|uniref:MerR family DNA-binding transcriptional regulator n=1 Tax=Pelagibius litoralis TaxID=374515 RepID=A0A967F2C1_9PROT|nr:MerR family DNA-binding transcriptional regulator [Pelagibius litoralis]